MEDEQIIALYLERSEHAITETDTKYGKASTVYFNAKWHDEFRITEKESFHSPSGKKVCDFMKQSDSDNYYYGDRFSAVGKGFDSQCGTMYFILPDEGITPEELLSDAQAMEFILSAKKWQWENKKYLQVNLAVPKFDITSELDLAEGLKALGVTDVFAETKADFSNVTDVSPCILKKAEHDVRVMIDEEGCTATAYTVLLAEAGADMPPEEEIDFVLNRPFIFVITSYVGLPLFIGIVNQPE